MHQRWIWKIRETVLFLTMIGLLLWFVTSDVTSAWVLVCKIQSWYLTYLKTWGSVKYWISAQNKILLIVFLLKISSLNQPAFCKVTVLKISGFSIGKDLSLRICRYNCLASIIGAWDGEVFAFCFWFTSAQFADICRSFHRC